MRAEYSTLDFRLSRQICLSTWGERVSSSPRDCWLRAALDGDIAALLLAQVYLPRPRDFLLPVEQHLFPLSDPPGRARNGEQYWEHGHRETHRLIDQPAVEVHVGIQLAADEVIVFQGDALAFQRDLGQWVPAHHLKHFVGDALDDAGPRVIILVDAMSEAHQLVLADLHALDIIRDARDGANFHQHAQYFLIGAAMQRPVKRSS